MKIIFKRRLPKSLSFSFTFNVFFIFQDIQSVRNLLRRRGLSTSSIRKVCVTGSASAVQVTVSSFLLLGLAFLFY